MNTVMQDMPLQLLVLPIVTVTLLWNKAIAASVNWLREHIWRSLSRIPLARAR